MICQQVFTVSSKIASHLANTYALEYNSAALQEKYLKYVCGKG